MKAKVYDIEGNAVKEIDLPSIFATPYRKEVIARAVISEESKERQPKGAYRWAGLETSATYVGRKEAYKSLKNRGQAMRPREFYGGGIPGRVRIIPSSVKGRRAHPPKPEKKIEEKMNKKEYMLALRSAIAATANREIVITRGHKVDVDLPIIISFNNLDKATIKTKTFVEFLSKIMPKELERAAKKRGRNKKYPKSALLVCAKDELKFAKAIENIKGVDAVNIDELKVKHLAPGTHAGRVAIYTEKAIEEMRKWQE
ncbi:MAG: 50S ribosomal protein L4 [Candidatus Anstonellales archaeon]